MLWSLASLYIVERGAVVMHVALLLHHRRFSAYTCWKCQIGPFETSETPRKGHETDVRNALWLKSGDGLLLCIFPVPWSS